jgi:hypothetical protein
MLIPQFKLRLALFSLLLVTALAGPLTSPAFAQEPFGSAGGTGATAQERAPSPNFEAQLNSMVNISGEGLTLEQFVDSIQKQSGEFNVLIEEDLKGKTLAPFRLQKVRVLAALNLIPKLANDESILLEVSRETEQQANLVTISHDKDASYVETKVLPVKAVLEKMKAETLLASLEKGVKFFGSSETQKLQVALEADSGLLFLRGTGEQVDILCQVFSAICENLQIPAPSVLSNSGGGGGGFGDMGGGMGGTGGGMGGSGGWGFGAPGFKPPTAQISKYFIGGMGGPDGSVIGGVQGKYVIRTIGGQHYVFIEGQPATAYLVGSPEGEAAIERALSLPSKVDPSGNPAGQTSNSDGQ